MVSTSREQERRIEAPMAISQVSPQLIVDTKATAPYQLLNKVAGVYMVNLGNEQHMMAIRQPISTNAVYLYLEDGLPIRPIGIFNHNALYEINQAGVRGVGVVKGPASSLYGSNAIGGAINFLTQRPTPCPRPACRGRATTTATGAWMPRQRHGGPARAVRGRLRSAAAPRLAGLHRLR
ncbi:MAG: TonB-dependent receptor plug domain-containing protein [Hymenobacter sp.]